MTGNVEVSSFVFQLFDIFISRLYPFLEKRKLILFLQITQERHMERNLMSCFPFFVLMSSKFR